MNQDTPFKDIKERNPISLATNWAPFPSARNMTLQDSNSTNIQKQIEKGLPTAFLHTKFPIHSALPHQEAYAMLLKSFPTPNCLDLFETLLTRWGKPVEKKNRFTSPTGEKGKQLRPLWIVGDAGTGKTSLLRDTTTLIFGKKSKDPEGNEINPEPLFFSAGGKNLDDLLVEKIFDSEGKRFIQELQDRFNDDKLSRTTRNSLIRNFPKLIDPESQIINFETIEPNPTVINQLKSLAELEGISLSPSALGIRLVEGKLIKACREGRVLIIDELDKCLPGTGKKLNEVLLTVAGNTRQSLHFEEGNISYTFGPKTIHNNFDLVCPANNANDTSEPNEFVESFKDRFKIVYIQPASLDDLSLRISQSLLGFNPWPVQIGPLKNKSHEVIPLLYKQIGEPLNDEQTLLLKNLPKTMQACRQLAAMTLIWNQEIKNTADSTDEILQANEKNLPLIGTRWIQNIIHEATEYEETALQLEKDIPNSPNPSNITDFLAAFQENTGDQEIIPLGLGEKIEVVIQKHIQSFPVGPETKTKLARAAILCGVLPEPDEEHNENPQKLPLIRQLLKTQEEIQIKPETLELHKKLTEVLIKKSPELQNTQKERIIPITELQKMVDELGTAGKDNCLIGLNDTYLKEKNGHPIRLIPIPNLHNLNLTKPLNPYLMETAELEAIFHHSTLKKALVENMWEHNPNPNTPDADITESFSGKHPELRVCKILSKSQDKHKEEKREYTLLLHFPKEKNQLLAYNPHFKEDQETPNSLLTNSSEKAQKYLEDHSKNHQIDLSYILFSMTNPIKSSSHIEEESYEETINSLETKDLKKLLEDATNPNKNCLLDVRSPYKGPLKENMIH